MLREAIERVWKGNFGTCGAREAWRQLVRAGVNVHRCMVERLAREMGFQGVVRGRKRKRAFADDTAPRPADLVERNITAGYPGPTDRDSRVEVRKIG